MLGTALDLAHSFAIFVPSTVCSVGSVGDAGRQRHAAPGGGALLCGGGDGGGHPELGQVRSQPLGSGEHPGDTLLVQCTSTVLYYSWGGFTVIELKSL